MKVFIAIFLVLAAISAAWFIFSRKTNTESTNPKNGASAKPEENPYNDLRNLALNANAEAWGIQAAPNRVFGIVMDWDLNDGVSTLVVYKTGDASIYLSSGGGLIGGIEFESVRNAVVPYIAQGQQMLSSATQANTTALPPPNHVRFYLLTDEGTFTAEESMENIEKGTSQLLPLFSAANDVITALREASEMR